MFLTAEELAEWLETKHASRQAAWLDAHGFRGCYTISHKGRVKILRSVVEAAMGAAVSAQDSTKPNWDAIRGPAQA